MKYSRNRPALNLLAGGGKTGVLMAIVTHYRINAGEISDRGRGRRNMQIQLSRVNRKTAAVSARSIFAAFILTLLSPTLSFAQLSCADAEPLSKSTCSMDVGADLVIGDSSGCKNIKIERSRENSRGNNNALGKITIESGGQLCILDGRDDITIETAGIDIKNGGALRVGSKTAPIGQRVVTLRFTGERPTHCQYPPQPLDADCFAGSDDDFTKGIQVRAGATLELYGAKGVPKSPSSLPEEAMCDDSGKCSWTHLSKPAGPKALYGEGKGVGSPVTDDTTLHLARDVSEDWRQGDWIVVGGTSFSPFESEFVRIESVTTKGGGSVIMLDPETPLVHYHFGGPDPGFASDPSNPNKQSSSFEAGMGKNYGVDERAPIGLISRNIKLTAAIEDAPRGGRSIDPRNRHWGGEIKILRNFETVAIAGVEIEQFGKEKLASYPIHFHMAGAIADANAPLINANSIHHSYNKCITIHDTQNMTVQNNVCARIVGHIFYTEAGTEKDVNFFGNLGLGAMSHSFGIQTPEQEKQYWWRGDYMVRQQRGLADYDGFMVYDTASQMGTAFMQDGKLVAGSRGSCALPEGNGGLVLKGKPFAPQPVPTPPPDKEVKFKGACPPGHLYFEPSSGFWITHPTINLIGNSIGGCQGAGKGYWYLANPANQYAHLGRFRNNRAHGCFSGLYAENDVGTNGAFLSSREGGMFGGQDKLMVFDGFTGFRIRDRGIWLRPAWFVVKNARLATVRDAVSLLTAGGADGVVPGGWLLFKNSVVVGISSNNVDRFGPCPYPDQAGQGTGFQGENVGCIDRTPNPDLAKRGEFIERGYPRPDWNFFGFYIYDGPARIFDNRFVNFNNDIRPYLTTADRAFLDFWGVVRQPYRILDGWNQDHPWEYEGDAALGWFNVNQSSYPPTQASEGFIFDNVDLRHQIFTEKVNFGGFADGDKNTVLVDRDGSLTDMKVVDENGDDVPDVFPISFNNLPLLAASNSADECLAEGQQNMLLEDHPTSLISPGEIASFEFFALLDSGLDLKFAQEVTFTKDILDYPTLPGFETKHFDMTLNGRNGLGVWEPKFTNGFAYTIQTAPATQVEPDGKPPKIGQAGIPKFVSMGYTDAHTTDLETTPFVTRVGICYKTKGSSHVPSASDFEIKRGYKSYGQVFGGNEDHLTPRFWNLLQDCKDLDNANPDNTDFPGFANPGCPAEGKAAPIDGRCDGGLFPGTLNGACTYPLFDTFTPVNDITKLTPESYFYDQQSGMLYLLIVQDVPNARIFEDGKEQSPSPLGNCLAPNSDPDCPVACADGEFQNPFPDCSCTSDFNPCPQANDPAEEYYACPAQGCPLYTVKVNDSQYVPGESDCDPYQKPEFVQKEPFDFAKDFFPDSKVYKLAYVTDDTVVEREPVVGMPVLFKGDEEDFPHYEAVNAPSDQCPVNAAAAIPPWGATADAFFLLANGPAGMQLTVTQNGSEIPVIQPGPTNPEAVLQAIAAKDPVKLEATFTENQDCEIDFTVSKTEETPDGRNPKITIINSTCNPQPQPPNAPPPYKLLVFSPPKSIGGNSRTPEEAVDDLIEDLEDLIDGGPLEQTQASPLLKQLTQTGNSQTPEEVADDLIEDLPDLIDGGPLERIQTRTPLNRFDGP
jgi:G8 domain